MHLKLTWLDDEEYRDGAAHFWIDQIKDVESSQPSPVGHSFNHFVGERKHGGRNGKTECLGSLDVE
jgi:hypothetical protein